MVGRSRQGSREGGRSEEAIERRGRKGGGGKKKMFGGLSLFRREVLYDLGAVRQLGQRDPDARNPN